MAITIALCRRSCSAIHLLLAICLTTACGCEWGGSRVCNLSRLIARRKRKIHNPPLSLIDSSKSCDISFWGNYLYPSCLMASTGKKRGQPIQLLSHFTHPGRPFRGPNAPQEAFDHLRKYPGVNPEVASNRLHRLKEPGGLGPADNVAIRRTGDVYNAQTGERMGSLTDKSLSGRKR